MCCSLGLEYMQTMKIIITEHTIVIYVDSVPDEPPRCWNAGYELGNYLNPQ